MTDEVWSEFQRTTITLDLGGRRLGVTPADDDRVGDFPPGVSGPIHVLTAWNPQGIEAPLAANRAANERLAVELADLPARVWPTVGTGEDGSWSEEGFSIAGLTRAEALALAIRYDQRAIFEWTNEPGGFRLVSCDESADEPRGWISTWL